jgi:hypothetical protein
MNLEEKIELVHGCSGEYIGNTKANPRLGIPALRMQDSPQVRSDSLSSRKAIY